MVDDTPGTPIASSSSKKGRLIPSSFRKAGNLTSDQQTRLLRIQAAKNHVQDWETLELINYSLLNNAFDSVLGILYEYARCLDRLERYFDIIHEIIIKLQESIQTTKLLEFSFDEIIRSFIQAIKTILSTICSLRRIQGTPISLYENNSKIIITPNITDSKSIFKFIEDAAHHLEKYSLNYKVDLSTLSSEQLAYIFAATSKVNAPCNKKILESRASKELRDSIIKVVSIELKINTFWEKVDSIDSLRYPTLKLKLSNTNACPTSLQFFSNELSSYDSLVGKLSNESVPTENPPAKASIPLINMNGVKSNANSKSSKASHQKSTKIETNSSPSDAIGSKKKEKTALPPAGINKSLKTSTPKKQPAIGKGKSDSTLVPKNVPVAENIKKNATALQSDVQVSSIPEKTPIATTPNAQKDDCSDSSSSSDEDVNNIAVSTNQNNTKVPRHRSVSIAVMERADSFALSNDLENYSKKRRSTVVGSIAVDNKKEPQLKRASSVRLTQIPNFDPSSISIRRADSQRSKQEILQTSVPFNQSRRNSSAKSGKSMSDVSSDDYDDLPYEEVDPEPIKTNYTSSSFEIGSMNSSFNYDAYDKTSYYSSATPEASPVRTRAQSSEINRARAQSSEKINRARATSDDFNSPYKQHKRQISKTQELFSSLSSLLSPYLPGASKAESQVIHLALRDLESSGHTSGSGLVELAARKIAIWWSFVGPRQKLRRRMVIRNMCIEVINMCAYRAVSKSVSKRKRRFRWLLNHAALQIQRCLRAFIRKKYQGRQFNYNNNNIPKISASPFNRRRVNSNERVWSPLPATPEKSVQRKYNEVRPVSGNKQGSLRPGSGATINSGKSSDSGGKKTTSTDDKSSKNRQRTSSGEDGSASRASRPSGRVRTASTERFNHNSVISYGWMSKSPSAKAWYAAVLIQKVIRRYVAIVRVDKLFLRYDASQRDHDTYYQGSMWSRRYKNHYSSSVKKKIVEAVITIQRIVRGKLARKRSFHIVKAGVLLNRKLNEFKSLKQLRMRLRRIERPLIIKLDNIYNIPNGTFRSDNVKIVVSIWWSPLLHIVSELDFGTIIEGKKPQVQVKFENISIMKQIPELLQKMDTYLETDSAIATEKKQYDRENLSKHRKSDIISFPSISARPSIVAASTSNNNGINDPGGNISAGGGHKRLGSILATLADDDGSDTDDASTDDDVHNTELPTKSNDHRGSFLLNRFDGIRKSSRSFIPSLRHSLNGLFNPNKRRSIAEVNDMLPSCLDLQGKTIRIPGCHGNSVVKVEIYDDDRKVGNKIFFLSKHGGWLFWGGKYSEEVKLSGASRLDGSRRISLNSNIKPKINFIVKSGEALHSKAAQSIYVKIRGTGPAKLALRTKGLDLSFFEKKFSFYISLNYEDGLGLYHKKSNLEPFYVVPAKDIMSVRLEQGQWVDGGSTLQDSHEIILNTNTYDEIVIRLDSVGNRVRWIEVLENILERNKAAILKFQNQRNIYANITKLGKLFEKSPKNQGPVVRRLRGGLQ